MGDETEKTATPMEPAPPLLVAEEAASVTLETSPSPAEKTAEAIEAVPEHEKTGESTRETAPAAEKASEEASAASATAEEQEEQLAEAVEHAEEKTVVEDRELISPIPVATEEAAPFVEESYYVKDLKESEKKALQELKVKIAEAINNKTFFGPPKPVVTTREAEVEVKKEEEEEKKEEEGAKKEEEEEDKKQEREEKKEEEEDKKREHPLEVKDHKTPLAEPEEIPAVPVEAGVVTTEAPSVTEASVVEAVVVEDVAAPVAEAPPIEEEKQVCPDPETEPVVTEREVVLEEDDSPSLEDLTLWGVPLLPTKGDERTDVILLKFLRARDFKVNDAMTMLKDTAIWRKEFQTDDLVGEEITTEFDSVAYMHGVDKEGHPVCYNHYGVFQDKELYQKTFGDEAQFKKFLRWRIQVLEKGMQKLDFSPSGVHSMVQVIDLKDSPGFAKRRNITRKALGILQDNYPELVAKQIFINVPWYFGALYSLHGKFVTARSKSKGVVARPEKVTETLFKYVSPENVPVRYGGFSRPGDTEFQGVEAQVKEVSLKAGEKQTIELLVEEGGTTTVWDVVVVGWDVVYGEEFVPSTEGGYTVVIQKAKKVTIAEEPMRNSFKAANPGKVVITIENTSRRKKLVVYRHISKEDTPFES